MQHKRRLYVVVLVICVLLALPTVAHAAHGSPVRGVWRSIDVDGSTMRLVIAGRPDGPFRITWRDSYLTVCDGGRGIIRGWGRLIDGDPNRVEARLRVRCFETGEVTRFKVTMEYLPDTNRLRITYPDGRFVICYRPGQVQSNATIVVSAGGDFLWTSDFTPWDELTISVYESAQAGAACWYTSTKTANQWGFVLIDSGVLDFKVGDYVTVSDSFVEKGLLLESITWDVFDAGNDFAAGTAPAGREVMVVVADSPDPEDQYHLWVDADPDGNWTADFSGIVDFPDDHLWRGFSFAQIFDADGDANEAGLPPPPRSMRTPNYYVVWSETNPEEVTYLSWRGSDNLVSVWAHPDYCTDEDLEFFGNSWASENEGTPDLFFESLVGWGTTGTWAKSGLQVAIASECTGCSGPTGIPVSTTYQFFEEEAKADLITVKRGFDFGDTPYNHDVRPFIPRLYPGDGFTEVLHPDASGTMLRARTTYTCGYGCQVADWNGTWFALHNPETGLGMIVQHAASAHPVDLWVDNDAGSSTNSSAVLLLQPPLGFTGVVTDVEHLCFYHSGLWTPQLTLPPGCQP
jgi:hypothetical protein